MLLFADKIPTNRTAFEQKVIEISQKLGINPNWLMLLMWHESQFKTTALNPNGGATGLIQFMPRTATGLGTSTDQLAKMDNIKQLDYVYKYFKPYQGNIKSYSDLHLITFFPAAIGKPDSFVFEEKGVTAAKIAKVNSPFDLNKDNKITAGEARQYFANFAKQKVPKEFVKQFENFTNSMKYLDLAVVVAMTIILGVFVYKLIKSW